MLRPFRRSLERHVRAGVAHDGLRAGLARVQRSDDGRLSLAVQSFEATASKDWAAAAGSYASRLNLHRVPLSTVLPAGSYQLQLVELPNVPAEELLAAVRWRIKDLIDFPLDEAVVELLEMPPHANAGGTAIAYAVVSRQSEILQQIDMMKTAGLCLDVIDIPELCMRNIAVLLPQDEIGVALLHFAEDCGYLTITHKGTLHMLRRLDTGRSALARLADDAFAFDERIAGLALEVQRSLDYYESHYDCRPVSEIVLGPGAHLAALPDALSAALGLSVSSIGLEDLFAMEAEVSLEEQGSCLLAVGAALRDEAPALRVA